VGTGLALRHSVFPMADALLLITTDVPTRDRFTRLFSVAAFRVLVAPSIRAALDRIAIDGVRPAVILVERRALRSEAPLWVAARASNPLIIGVPEIEVIDGDVVPALERAHAFVQRSASVQALLSTVLHRIRAARDAASPARTRFARGTGDTTSRTGEHAIDLHAFAEAKLMQYLGTSRAATTLVAITSELGIDRITSTADLHRVAASLRERGEMEAAVAALLSGRATLLDSDRTLDS
jgi:hypothetical protein